MTEHSPESVLASVLAEYRRFDEYEDDGIVYLQGTPVVSFRTRFRRGLLFEFSYSEVLDDGAHVPHSRLLWHDGATTLTSLLDTPAPESLSLAVAGLTGISSGSAHGAPSLLLEEVGGWVPTDLVEPVFLPDQLVCDQPCYYISGGHPWRPSQWSPGMSRALLRIEQRRRLKIV
jgi:hypothetical protein